MIEHKSDNGNEKKFFKKIISNDDNEIRTTLSDMRDIAVYARLRIIQTRLLHAFVVANLTSYTCKIKRCQIIVKIYDEEFCRVFLSRKTCEPDAIIYNDLGVTSKEFVHALSCDGCERVSISHSLFLVSIAKKLLYTVYSGVVDTLGTTKPVKSTLQRAICFSFAPSFLIRIADTTGKLTLDIVSKEDNTITSTYEMITLSNSPYLEQTKFIPIQSAVKSAKAACVILEFQKFLTSKGIEAQAENNKVHFLVREFECVEFKCNFNGTWNNRFATQFWL